MTTALLVSFAAPTFAQDADAVSASEFTLSESLQASFDALRETTQIFRASMKVSLEGLSGDDRRAVLEANKDEAEALRAEHEELRALADIELAAAGIERPDRPERPERGGNGEGNRGDRPDRGSRS